MVTPSFLVPLYPSSPSRALSLILAYPHERRWPSQLAVVHEVLGLGGGKEDLRLGLVLPPAHHEGNLVVAQKPLSFSAHRRNHTCAASWARSQR
jgi:hypothetical protein